MDITLNTSNDTIKISSQEIRQVLLDRTFEKIGFHFESCINPDLTTDCVNSQDYINDTENFSIAIPKAPNLIIQEISVYSIFANEYVNLIKTPLYYDSDHITLVQALQGQIRTSFQAMGIDGAGIVLEYVDGTNILTLTIKFLPIGWIAEEVKFNVQGFVQTDKFTHSITDMIFASNTDLFIKASTIGLTKFVNDVLKIKITIQLPNGACVIQEACFFVDVDLKCKVSTRLEDLQKNQLKTFLTYYGLGIGSGCETTCTTMCELLNDLLKTVNNGC